MSLSHLSRNIEKQINSLKTRERVGRKALSLKQTKCVDKMKRFLFLFTIIALYSSMTFAQTKWQPIRCARRQATFPLLKSNFYPTEPETTDAS